MDPADEILTKTLPHIQEEETIDEKTKDSMKHELCWARVGWCFAPSHPSGGTLRAILLSHKAKYSKPHTMVNHGANRRSDNQQKVAKVNHGANQDALSWYANRRSGGTGDEYIASAGT